MAIIGQQNPLPPQHSWLRQGPRWDLVPATGHQEGFVWAEPDCRWWETGSGSICHKCPSWTNQPLLDFKRGKFYWNQRLSGFWNIGCSNPKFSEAGERIQMTSRLLTMPFRRRQPFGLNFGNLWAKPWGDMGGDQLSLLRWRKSLTSSTLVTCLTCLAVPWLRLETWWLSVEWLSNLTKKMRRWEDRLCGHHQESSVHRDHLQQRARFLVKKSV